MNFKAVGNKFHAQGAAIENILSLICHLAFWTTRSQSLDDCKDDHKQITESDVGKSVMYSEAIMRK